MAFRVRSIIGLELCAGALSLWYGAQFPSHNWLRFFIYLVAVVLSSGMKVPMPQGEGTFSVNFPFILLGVVQLSPLQAITLAAISVFAQCRIKVANGFSFVQIAFNVANALFATALAWWVFMRCDQWMHELAPALCLAVTAYFFANSVPVSIVIGWSSARSPYRLWLREFPWYLPFYLVGAIVAAAADITSHRFGLTTSLLLVPVMYVIFRAYRAQAAVLVDRQRHLAEMEALHLRTIEGLAMAIEAKDQNTHNHLLRVRVYVDEIGRAMGLDSLQMQALLTAAFLHDIGKLAVPEHIVNKPGKLTHEEFEKMKIHPAVGADILERMRFPYPVAPIVRSHHEAFDGTGYPDGLKGEEIPIGARILSAVDCFDALASDRPYRKALPVEEAMKMMKNQSGKQFDPAVVAVLVERYAELERRTHDKRGEIVPLDIVSPVRRGIAPRAGLQQDNENDGEILDRTSAAAPLKLHSRSEAMQLIGAASQEAQTLFEMTGMLGNSLSPNETISVMSSRLKMLIPFNCFAVYLLHNDLLSTQYIDGDCARLFSKTLIRTGDGLSGWVAQSGKPILNGNARVEPNYEEDRSTNGGIQSALSLPLFNLSGDVFGVLTVYSVTPDVFSRDHLRILQAIEGKFSLSLQNALRFRSAEKEATIDFITQLPNMRQFFLGVEVQLDRAQRTNQSLGFIVCDLNSFKTVNDQHGHLAGNILLRSIADGFRKTCRSYDLVARMGGDEFVFLLPGVDEVTCQAQLKAIAQVVERACHQNDLDLGVSVSVGVAFYPDDGSTAEELLGVADRRMYLHKRTHYQKAGETGTSPDGTPDSRGLAA